MRLRRRHGAEVAQRQIATDQTGRALAGIYGLLHHSIVWVRAGEQVQPPEALGQRTATSALVEGKPSSDRAGAKRTCGDDLPSVDRRGAGSRFGEPNESRAL